MRQTMKSKSKMTTTITNVTSSAHSFVWANVRMGYEYKHTAARSNTTPHTHMHIYMEGLSRHICTGKGNLNHLQASSWKEDKWPGVCVCCANEHTAIVTHSCRLISYESLALAKKERVSDSSRFLWGGESLGPAAATGGLCFISGARPDSPFTSLITLP